MLPQAYQAPVAYLLLAGGTLACFAGYRLFRIVLGLYGFVIGALVGSALVGPSHPANVVLAAVLGGILGALILVFGYFLGVALVGAGLGVLVAHTVYSGLGREPHAIAIILFALAGAFGAMMLQRYVIILATAFGGAWTMIVAALAVVNGRAATATAKTTHLSVLYPLDQTPHDPWVPVACIVLGIVGTIVQLTLTAKKKKK